MPAKKKRGRQPADEETKFRDNLRRLLAALLPHLVREGELHEVALDIQRDTRCGPFDNEQGEKVLRILTKEIPKLGDLDVEGLMKLLEEELEIEAEWIITTKDKGKALTVALLVENYQHTKPILRMLRTEDVQSLTYRRTRGDKWWATAEYYIAIEEEEDED